MLVNPAIFGTGGGGKSPVVSTGLVVREKNDGTPQEPKKFAYQSNTAVSSSTDCTIEIHFTATGLPSGQNYGYLLQLPRDSTSYSLILSVSNVSGDIPTGGDWGFVITVGGYDYALSSVLLYDTPYTLTCKITNGEMQFYVNGVSDDTLTKTFSYNGNQFGAFRRSDSSTDSDRTVNGEWNEFRIYNRALTDAEILANYNADTANYET